METICMKMKDSIDTDSMYTAFNALQDTQNEQGLVLNGVYSNSEMVVTSSYI